MPGRRATTAPDGPTPLEEVPANAPAPEAPSEPPPAEELPPEDPDTDEAPVTHSRVVAMITNALSDVRRGPFGLVAAQREDYPLTVHEAIAEVTRRIDAIEKGHQASQGDRYWYRGIDDVFAALHPILGDVGLVIMPGEITSHRRETRTTAKGSTLNVAIIDVRYRLIGPDGTRTWGAASGEAHDSGDKATQKALSQAYKSFTLQLFSIPTEASAADEADADTTAGAPPTEAQKDRAAAAWRAASEATTYEKLAAVRYAAVQEGLLPVVLNLPDGPAPLGVLFDRRRAALDEGAR